MRCRKLWLLLALVSCERPAGSPEITLEGGRFRVTGLRSEAPDPGRDFAVYVVGQGDVPLFGEYRREGGALVFEPRFPLKGGMTYRAVYHPGPVERTFSVPAPDPGPPAFVREVYPSRDTLPENLLKFYLHFSAPLARGEAYRRVHLLDAAGKKVELPFLELGEELWDPAGTRLTLLFDPGRIKRGLKPREDSGPALEAGKAYALVVDRHWPDAAGRPLKEGYRKGFKAGPPDGTQPDPKRWKVEPPRAGGPLTVLLDEPLDHAMLGRCIAVVDGRGEAVAGRVEIDREETRWRFHPAGPWRAGRHALVVETILEDQAGNSVERPFEVDVFRPVERKLDSPAVRVPFDVAP